MHPHGRHRLIRDLHGVSANVSNKDILVLLVGGVILAALYWVAFTFPY